MTFHTHDCWRCDGVGAFGSETRCRLCRGKGKLLKQGPTWFLCDGVTEAVLT